MSAIIDKEIIRKFDVPGPRYTSYPTAPVWSEEVTQLLYTEKLKEYGQTDKTLSLYIHIPFCQSLCTFCACSVLIRPQDEKYSDEYLTHLFKEIELVAKSIGTKKMVRQLHFGGGTPTFLTETQIELLFKKLQQYFTIDLQSEIAIEIDPRTIDKGKLRKLKELGFNRVSMGVQDFDEKVQTAVNRLQPFSLVKEFNDWCRELKFSSVNFDLIYGLPFQTIQSFNDTVKKVISLKPDRIALYSFAYVPWLKKQQNKMDESTLPSNDEKLDIFLMARENFLREGYLAIAMDHFALKEDELSKAFINGSLHRNFMGYTVKPADEYIGLGLTSIGFLESTYIQNHKILSKYYELLDAGYLPVERGKMLTQDDQVRRWTINSLMCQFKVDKIKFRELFSISFEDYYYKEEHHIAQCVEDGLIENDVFQLTVSELGKIFIRNVCMGFDIYFCNSRVEKRFSKAV